MTDHDSSDDSTLLHASLLAGQTNNNSFDDGEKSNGILNGYSDNFAPEVSEIESCDYTDPIDPINNIEEPECEQNVIENLVDVFQEIVDDDSKWLYNLSGENNEDNSGSITPLDWLRASFNEDDLTLIKRSLSTRLSQVENDALLYGQHSSYARRPSNFSTDFPKDSLPQNNFGYSTFKVKRKLPTYTSSPVINHLKNIEDNQTNHKITRQGSIDEIKIPCRQPEPVSTPVDFLDSGSEMKPKLQSPQISHQGIKRPSALPKFSSSNRRINQSPLASPRCDSSPTVDLVRTKAESLLQRRRLLPQTPIKSPSYDQVKSSCPELAISKENNSVITPVSNLPALVEDVNLNPIANSPNIGNDDINSHSCGNSSNSSKENLNRTYSKEELSILKAQINRNDILASSSNNSSELDNSDLEETAPVNARPKTTNHIGRFAVSTASKSNLGKSIDCLAQKPKPESLGYQKGGLTRSKSTLRYTDQNRNASTNRVGSDSLKFRAVSSTKLSTISDVKSPAKERRTLKPPSVTANPPVSTVRKSSLPVRNKSTVSSSRPSTASSRGLPVPKVVPNSRQVNSAVLPRKIYKK